MMAHEVKVDGLTSVSIVHKCLNCLSLDWSVELWKGLRRKEGV